MSRVKAKRRMLVPVVLLLILYLASPILAGALGIMDVVRPSWYLIPGEFWGSFYGLGWEAVGRDDKLRQPIPEELKTRFLEMERQRDT